MSYLYILVILFYKNAPKAANLPTQMKTVPGEVVQCPYEPSGAKAQDGAFPTW